MMGSSLGKGCFILEMTKSYILSACKIGVIQGVIIESNNPKAATIIIVLTTPNFKAEAITHVTMAILLNNSQQMRSSRDSLASSAVRYIFYGDSL